MDDPPLNPAQHVERIREILVGRQMHQVEDRIRDLEGTVSAQGAQVQQEVAERVQDSQTAVLEETQLLRQQLRQESQLRSEQIDRLSQQLEATCRNVTQHDKQLQQSLSSHLETISTAMAARIDARVREILQHLQNEIVQWKNQIDRDVNSVRDNSVSRTEMQNRFSRLASAAMEEDPAPEDGFHL